MEIFTDIENHGETAMKIDEHRIRFPTEKPPPDVLGDIFVAQNFNDF